MCTRHLSLGVRADDKDVVDFTRFKKPRNLVGMWQG